MSNFVWDLVSAVSLARELEAAFDGSAHVALGGSVLYDGVSSKDVDLFIYPHKAWTFSVIDIHRALESFGFVCKRDLESVKKSWDKKAEEEDNDGYTDEKFVEIWTYKGKRVDVFMPWVHDED